MQQDHIPSPLVRIAMRTVPASVLQRMIDALMQRMRRRHSRLFENLGRLGAAIVRIEPIDVPHRFRLAYGDGEVSLVVADCEDRACSACIKGNLDALLNMLEGRIDGDKLFFSRDIEISGDTGVIVALRNTLDREVIDLLDDVTSLFGPFARPAREMVLLANNIARHVRKRITKLESKKAAGL
jgi:O2-independent ubiquinone biosynthesis accessory factor UbiT